MSVKPIELSGLEQEHLRTIVKKGSDWRERERAQTILMLSEGQTVLRAGDGVAEYKAGSDSRAASEVVEKRDGEFAGPTTERCVE